MRIAALGRISTPRYGETVALGRLSESDIVTGNEWIDRLTQDLVAYNLRIRQVEQGGFSESLTRDLRLEYATLQGRVGGLADELHVISAGAFTGWLERAGALRQEIYAASERAARRVAAEGPTRTAKLTLKTTLVIAAALFAVGGAWWYSKKFRRFRYGEGRRYGMRKGQRRRI